VTALLALMNPTRWAVLGAVLLALLAALWGLHRHGYNAGADAVFAEWARAKAQAQADQDARTEQAEKTLIEETEVIRYVYRDRFKEVTQYVPIPGTTCPADADFVRLFNAAR
jgi:hypothetical protein